MFAFKKSPSKRDEFQKKGFSFAQYHEEAQDFYYKKRKGIRRQHLSVIACFYYPDMRDTQHLYIVSDYVKQATKAKYWAVVSFNGTLQDRLFRGYLPISVLDDPVNVRVIKKGEKIGVMKSDKAWCDMYVVPAFKLESSLPNAPAPREVDASLAAAYSQDNRMKEATLHGQPAPSSPNARKKWMHSVQVRSGWGKGDKLDVKSDGMWYSATIIDVNQETDLMLVHYDGFDSGFDHWVSRDSLDLAPHGKFSKPISKSPSNASLSRMDRPTQRFAKLTGSTSTDDIGALDQAEGYNSSAPKSRHGRRWSTNRTGPQLQEFRRSVSREFSPIKEPSHRHERNDSTPGKAPYYYQGGAGAGAGAGVDMVEEGISYAAMERINRLEKENEELKKENAELARRMRIALQHQRMVYEVSDVHDQGIEDMLTVKQDLMEWQQSLKDWQEKLSAFAISLSVQRDSMSTWMESQDDNDRMSERLYDIDREILKKENALFALNKELETRNRTKAIVSNGVPVAEGLAKIAEKGLVKQAETEPEKPQAGAEQKEEGKDSVREITPRDNEIDEAALRLQKRADKLQVTIAKVQAMNDEVSTPRPDDKQETSESTKKKKEKKKKEKKKKEKEKEKEKEKNNESGESTSMGTIPGLPLPLEQSPLGNMLGINVQKEEAQEEDSDLTSDESSDEQRIEYQKGVSSKAKGDDRSEESESDGSSEDASGFSTSSSDEDEEDEDSSSSEAEDGEDDREKIEKDLIGALTPRGGPSVASNETIRKTNSMEVLPSPRTSHDRNQTSAVKEARTANDDDDEEKKSEETHSLKKSFTISDEISEVSKMKKASKVLNALEQARATRMRIKAEREKKAQKKNPRNQAKSPLDANKRKSEDGSGPSREQSLKQREMMMAAFKGAAQVPVVDSPKTQEADAKIVVESPPTDDVAFPESLGKDRDTVLSPQLLHLQHHRETSTDSGYDMFDEMSDTPSDSGATPTATKAPAADADADADAGKEKEKEKDLDQFKDSEDDFDEFDMDSEEEEEEEKQEDKKQEDGQGAGSAAAAAAAASKGISSGEVIQTQQGKGQEKEKEKDSHLDQFKDSDDDFDEFDVGSEDGNDEATPVVVKPGGGNTNAALDQFRDNEEDADMGEFDMSEDEDEEKQMEKATTIPSTVNGKDQKKGNDLLDQFRDSDEDLDEFDVGPSSEDLTDETDEEDEELVLPSSKLPSGSSTSTSAMPFSIPGAGAGKGFVSFTPEQMAQLLGGKSNPAAPVTKPSLALDDDDDDWGDELDADPVPAAAEAANNKATSALDQFKDLDEDDFDDFDDL